MSVSVSVSVSVAVCACVVCRRRRTRARAVTRSRWLWVEGGEEEEEEERRRGGGGEGGGGGGGGCWQRRGKRNFGRWIDDGGCTLGSMQLSELWRCDVTRQRLSPTPAHTYGWSRFAGACSDAGFRVCRVMTKKIRGLARGRADHSGTEKQTTVSELAAATLHHTCLPMHLSLSLQTTNKVKTKTINPSAPSTLNGMIHRTVTASVLHSTQSTLGLRNSRTASQISPSRAV